MKRSVVWIVVLAAGMLAAGGRLRAGEATTGGSATGPWPQFHGPRRDNKSTDTGLLKRWPAGGPALIFKTRGMGAGYSSVAISDGRILTAGDKAGKNVVTAMDMRGKILWQQPAGPAWRRPYPGSHSTPTIVGSRLYHMNAHGDVVCMETDTGKRVWRRNVLEDFDGRNIRWGLAESPLVVGDKLICCPGGPKVSMVALDVKTGKTLWQLSGVGDRPGYSSPILVEYGGLRQIVTTMSSSAIGVELNTGRLLWKVHHPARHDENILTPIYRDGHVFFSVPHNLGATRMKLLVEGKNCSVEKVWHSKELDNKHGQIVLVGEYLYGHGDGDDNPRWVCTEWATGKTMYSDRGPGKRSGTLTYADGMLYIMGDEAIVGLVPCTPKGFEIVSRFTLPDDGKGYAWAHPVVLAGRLYIRHGEMLYAYDVRQK